MIPFTYPALKAAVGAVSAFAGGGWDGDTASGFQQRLGGGSRLVLPTFFSLHMPISFEICIFTNILDDVRMTSFFYASLEAASIAWD